VGLEAGWELLDLQNLAADFAAGVGCGVDVEVPLLVEEVFGLLGREGGGAVDGANDRLGLDEDDGWGSGGFRGRAVEMSSNGGAGEVTVLDVVGEEVGVGVEGRGDFAVAGAFFGGDFPSGFEGRVELDDLCVSGEGDEGQCGGGDDGADESSEVFQGFSFD